MRRALGLLAMLPLMACVPAAGPTASLPFDAVQGAGDPTRSAIFSTAYAFNNPGGLADPAVAARAAANLEWLADNIPLDPRYSYPPALNGQLAQARLELHAALLVSPNAPPQAVVDGLYGASRALRLNDSAAAAQALPSVAFPNGPATLLRLAALPPLPLSAAATAMAERELQRGDQERINNNRRGGGGRRG
jgi:hypothetical protein